MFQMRTSLRHACQCALQKLQEKKQPCGDINGNWHTLDNNSNWHTPDINSNWHTLNNNSKWHTRQQQQFSNKHDQVNVC